ncbi:MAG: hypothetical protein H6R26_2390 [Proteobacteria bacterium]|nr:hypothetical protein [Pseudomonadota bacterium]
MRKTILATTLTLALGGFSSLGLAAEPAAPASEEQNSLSLLRASLRMDKREFIKAAVALDAKQSEKFWSLYHQYEAELMKLNDQRAKLIEDYAANFDKITDAKADKLAKTAFELQKARQSLLENYYKKVAKAVSPTVAARFAQAENVVNSALDVKLGTSIPLMPKQ